MMLPVQCEHAGGADDEVINVGPVLTDGNGVDDMPPRVTLDQLGQPSGDLLLPIGADAPRPLVGVHAQHSRHGGIDGPLVPQLEGDLALFSSKVDVR